jgi:hypothetical protein
VGDRRRERDERFKVVIFNVENGRIGEAIGTGTIVNDDGGSHHLTMATGPQEQ